MATEVLVPPLGQTVDTLTLLSWYKQEGETIAQGEPLYVVETDKASLDVEAPASGILRLVTAQPGDQVKVLSAIAVIEAKVEAEAKAKVKAEAKAKVKGETGSTSTSISASASTLRRFVSPRARRLAESEAAPLAAIKPTGPEGAIIERDVRAYVAEAKVKAEAEHALASASASTSTSTLVTPVARRVAEGAGLDLRSLTGTGPRGQITREDVAQRMTADKRIEVVASGLPSNLQSPTSSVRALIAQRMVAGHTQTAPVTLTAEADATALVELRRQLAADGVAVSYNDLFLTILAKALGEHPRLNASLDGNAIKLWRQIDIGLAVDAERGLLAPVVRDVAHKGLAQLAAETAALAERARAGRCIPDELTGSTFTLTNLGMFGIDAFTPIINLPECAILGVGRIKTQPVWANDHVEPRQMVWLSLTFDHRLVDGGPAARFLQRVAQLAAKPHLLMA